MFRELIAEGGDNQDNRNRELLEDILGDDKKTYISISSHSGEITSILRGEFGFIFRDFFIFWILDFGREEC